MKWTLKSKKEVYKNQYMVVTEDEVITDKGYNLTYGIVHKKEAVGIIPIDGEYIYLVKQYRYPIDFDSWEFPQGHFEHKSIQEAAVHELHEEAGLSANSFKMIGNFYLAPGHNTQEYWVYVATGLKEVGQKLDPDEEGMIVGKFKISEVEKMISSGIIKDGPTISIFKLLEIYLKKHG
jgi:8-oxo-dGTP pyrophosphatase MutT (NUDIX family)